MRKIVCAASRVKSGLIVCGARHCDSIMLQQLSCAQQRYTPAEEGFIDNWGKFLTREEAWVVAKNANQIIREVAGEGCLYSENLY